MDRNHTILTQHFPHLFGQIDQQVPDLLESGHLRLHKVRKVPILRDRHVKEPKVYQSHVLLTHVQQRFGQPWHDQEQTARQRLPGVLVLGPLDVPAPQSERFGTPKVAKEIQLQQRFVLSVVGQPVVQLAKVVLRIAPVGDPMATGREVFMFVDLAERDLPGIRKPNSIHARTSR